MRKPFKWALSVTALGILAGCASTPSYVPPREPSYRELKARILARYPEPEMKLSALAELSPTSRTDQLDLAATRAVISLPLGRFNAYSDPLVRVSKGMPLHQIAPPVQAVAHLAHLVLGTNGEVASGKVKQFVESHCAPVTVSDLRQTAADAAERVFSAAMKGACFAYASGDAEQTKAELGTAAGAVLVARNRWPELEPYKAIEPREAAAVEWFFDRSTEAGVQIRALAN